MTQSGDRVKVMMTLNGGMVGIGGEPDPFRSLKVKVLIKIQTWLYSEVDP